MSSGRGAGMWGVGCGMSDAARGEAVEFGFGIWEFGFGESGGAGACAGTARGAKHAVLSLIGAAFGSGVASLDWLGSPVIMNPVFNGLAPGQGRFGAWTEDCARGW